MRKLTVIISTVLIAFLAASVLVYRWRLHPRAHQRSVPRQSLVTELTTAEGQIETVDVNSGTLKLTDGEQEIVFTFDDRTAILQEGHAIAPDSIETGADARVRYAKRGGKNWARRIELVAAEKGD
jgi:hypothetical protein